MKKARNTIKENRLRYRLHAKVKKEGFRVAPRQRTLFVPYTCAEPTPSCRRLMGEFGYAIQVTIV